MGNRITIQNSTNGPISGTITSAGFALFSNIPVGGSTVVTTFSSTVFISLDGQSCPESRDVLSGVTDGSTIIVSGDLTNCSSIRFKLLKRIIPGITPISSFGISLVSAPVKINTFNKC